MTAERRVHYNKNKNICIVLPPKCGSRSMNSWVKENGFEIIDNPPTETAYTVIITRDLKGRIPSAIVTWLKTLAQNNITIESIDRDWYLVTTAIEFGKLHEKNTHLLPYSEWVNLYYVNQEIPLYNLNAGVNQLAARYNFTLFNNVHDNKTDQTLIEYVFQKITPCMWSMIEEEYEKL